MCDARAKATARGSVAVEAARQVAVFFHLRLEVAEAVVELIHGLFDASQTAMEFVHCLG